MPCWLQEPYRDGRHGYIGVAAKYNVDGKVDFTASRQMALLNLVQGEPGLANFPIDSIDISQDEIALDGVRYYFSPEYESESALFSYLSNIAGVSAHCAASVCDVNSCTPQWLCKQSQASGVYVIGIGDLKYSAKQQWLDAESSASDIADYWGLQQVLASVKLLELSAARQSYSIIERDVSVNAVREHSHDRSFMRLSASCAAGRRLFQRWHLPNASLITVVESADKGYGLVTGYTVGGTLRSVIDLAIRNAYADLAYNKESNLTAAYKSVSGAHSLNAIQANAVLMNFSGEIAAELVELNIQAEYQKPYRVEVKLLESVSP